MKIVSGGQTGVDRAALDAAMQAGIECGGWCPEGRRAEDGIIDSRYPLTELAGAGYTERTRQNVMDSDGTLIINFGHLSGGTEQTLIFCIEAHKPYLLIDAEKITPERTAVKACEFIKCFSINTLNIAGPRSSSTPHAYQYTLQTVTALLNKAFPVNY